MRDCWGMIPIGGFTSKKGKRGVGEGSVGGNTGGGTDIRM